MGDTNPNHLPRKQKMWLRNKQMENVDETLRLCRRWWIQSNNRWLKHLQLASGKINLPPYSNNSPPEFIKILVRWHWLDDRYPSFLETNTSIINGLLVLKVHFFSCVLDIITCTIAQVRDRSMKSKSYLNMPFYCSYPRNTF